MTTLLQIIGIIYITQLIIIFALILNKGLEAKKDILLSITPFIWVYYVGKHIASLPWE